MLVPGLIDIVWRSGRHLDIGRQEVGVPDCAFFDMPPLPRPTVALEKNGPTRRDRNGGGAGDGVAGARGLR